MAGPAVLDQTRRKPCKSIASNASTNASAIGEMALLQASRNSLIPPDAWRAAEKADRARLAAQSSRQRRLARLYDRADRGAIGTTDPRTLATVTLAHWLYVRATADPTYPWSKMASDYRTGLLDRAGLAASDIRTMSRHSRPRIVRQILIASYGAYRVDRDRRHTELLKSAAD